MEKQLQDVKDLCREIETGADMDNIEFMMFFGIADQKIEDDDNDDYDESVGNRSIDEFECRGRLNQIENKEGNIWCPYWADSTKTYAFYFIIKFERNEYIKGKTHHIFSIAPCTMPDNALYIDKRYSDFLVFGKAIKKQKGVRPPCLPPKMIIFDQEAAERRGYELQEWLLFVSNEIKFHCRTLYTFIGLPNPNKSNILFRDIFANIQSKYTLLVKVIGVENEQFDNDSFHAYILKVEAVSEKFHDLMCTYQIKRRFKEFLQLNGVLKHTFYKADVPLPVFPSKLAYTKQSASERRYKLENYVKVLIDYPGVYDCIEFRKFFQVHPDQYRSGVENSFVINRIGSMDLSPQVKYV